MDTIERMADREILRYAVQREIFCPASGKILDIRRAVLLMGEGIKARVVHADVWDEHEGKILAAIDEQGLTPEVYDGRELFS